MNSTQVNHQSISNGYHHALSHAISHSKESSSLMPMENQNWLMYLYYTRKQKEKAISVIEQELSRSCGRNEYAHYLFGIIHFDEERYQEALEKFQTCNKLNPANIENIKQVGKCLFFQKRFKLALEALLEAENLSQKPDWEIHYWIAECLTKLGDSDGGLQWSKRSLKGGHHLEACKQLGNLFVYKGDLQSAVQAYSYALQCAPDNDELLTTLGLLHAKLGQQQLAVEQLGLALALGSPKAVTLLPLAAIIQSHGDYDVALSKYKIAAQQTPDCAALWNNIGMCFLGKQKLIAAMSCLKRATALSPLSTKILHNLGLVHLMSQQYASSFQFLCASLNIQSNSPQTLMLMAINLDNLQDYGNALKAYEKAIAISPDDFVIRLNYTMFLHSQDHTDLAEYHSNICDKLAKDVPPVDADKLTALEKIKFALKSKRTPDNSNQNSRQQHDDANYYQFSAPDEV